MLARLDEYCWLILTATIMFSGCATPKTEATIETAPVPSATKALTTIVAAVGDIMLGGSAAPEMHKYGYDHPFVHTREILKQADIVFGNLEGPLTHGGTAVKDKKYVFRSPPDEVAPALARAGFNVVSLANNHTLDYGNTGLTDTMMALASANIHHVGAGQNSTEARRPAILEVNGKRFAFLAYSLTFPEEFWATESLPGTAFGHETHIRTDVTKTKQKSDFVIVSFHWGREGATELRPYQSHLGKIAIDAGAVAVLGHHPHILQGIERYRDGVILHSLGNFAFGSYSNTATRSAIALLTFSDDRLHSLEMVPLNVKNTDVVFQPTPLNGKFADGVINELKRLSEPLGTSLENDQGRGILRWQTR